MTLLDRVMEWYEVAQDSQRVVAILLRKSPAEFPRDVVFATQTAQDALTLLGTARDELNDLVVISLVSIFERTLLDHLTIITSRISTTVSEPIALAALDYAFRNCERWHFPEVLDLFKSTVDGPLIGEVKQVCHYRNWVAHGRKEICPEPSVLPAMAYARLSEFLGRTGLA